MFGMKTVLLTCCAVAVLSEAGGASGCNAKQGTTADQNAPAEKRGTSPMALPTASPTASPTARVEGDRSMITDIKTLAEGASSGIEQPFVAVARDAETYAALSALVGALPAMDDSSFMKNVIVVAAFLGTRPTGGYGVQITRGANGSIAVAETKPPKDAMTTQALTTPFKIVSVPSSGDQAPALQLGETWRDTLRLYRVREGSFTASGGITGRSEQFRLEGDVRAARLGKLVTVALDLKGAGGSSPRGLSAATTGLAKGDGSFSITHLDAGTLVAPPNGGLQVTGQLDENGGRLSLKFTSLPSRASDSFSGTGNLEAFAVITPEVKN